MSRLTTVVKKEFTEGLRMNKWTIIYVAMVLFSLMNPAMLKLLPKILDNQMGEALASVIQMDMKSAVISGLGDLIQIMPIVMLLTTPNIVSKELKDNLALFPYTKGMKRGVIPVSKSITYSTMTLIATALGIYAGYIYSDILFDTGKLALMPVLINILYISAVFMFLWSLYIMLDTVLFKNYYPAILSLLIYYIVVYGYKILPETLQFLMPGKLLENVTEMRDFATSTDLVTLAVLIAYVILFNIGAIKLMERRKFG